MKFASSTLVVSLLFSLALARVHGGSLARGEAPLAAPPPGNKAKPTITQTRGREPIGMVHCLEFSPDGNTLAVCDGDVIRFYDSHTARERDSIRSPFQDGISKHTYSPDGRSLVVNSRNIHHLAIMDTATNRPRLTLEGPPSIIRSTYACLAFAPDGKTVAAGSSNGEVIFWDVEGGRRLAVTPPHMVPPHTEPFERADQPIPAPILAIAYTPDGATLLSFAYGSPLRAWDARSGAERMPPIKLERPGYPALTADRKVIGLTERVGDSKFQALRFSFWDATTWEKRSQWTTTQLAESYSSEFGLLPGGRILVSIQENFLTLRATEDGRKLASIDLPGPRYYTHLTVSRDGTRIAAGGTGWPLDTGAIDLVETDGSTLRRLLPKR